MEKLKTELQKNELTLFWLVFPVHKVDDISILQHVGLLLHQLGHVDDSAIGAKERHTNSSIYHRLTAFKKTFYR